MKNLKCIIFILLIFTNNAFAITEVKNIRVWPAPETIRVVLDLDKSAKCQVYTMSNPERVVIDIADSKLAAKFSKVALHNSEIKKIRTGVHPNQLLRVVLDMSQAVTPNSFILPPNDTYGYRLVVDLKLDGKDPLLELLKRPTSSEFVVAIDAGHGGEDPGAIGPRGTKEKDVALAVARYLCDLINKEKGMSAFLIRDGDYYISLRERMNRARARHAHLFLSIHADAFKNKEADGASVFVLSSKKASSEAARWLAQSENRADLVGGVSLDNRSNVLASVLLDLSQAASAKASVDAAKYVLKSLGKTTTLHRNHVESAGFMVLRSPDIPSLLIETGFISNPKTEQKLRNKKYQYKIASSIMQGVKDYKKYKAH